jgi:hypothetical protein
MSKQKKPDHFKAWAKAHIEKRPQDWVLLTGHDNEEHWARLAWNARDAEVAQLQARIRALEAPVKREP